jgi:hypothetical protein
MTGQLDANQKPTNKQRGWQNLAKSLSSKHDYAKSNLVRLRRQLGYNDRAI